MPPPWIEHGTFCLQGKRSTTELQGLPIYFSYVYFSIPFLYLIIFITIKYNRFSLYLYTSMNLQKYIRKLPEDVIINHIWPFLYEPMPETICKDIRSYHTTKTFLFQYYMSKYINSSYTCDFLLTDIKMFINNYNLYYFKYCNLYLRKFKNLFSLRQKSMERVYRYYKFVNCKKNKNSAINVQLAILNPRERKELLNFIKHIR